mgnify:CR=1 FL=1
MDTSAFEDMAEKTLEALFSELDEAVGDDADVDYEGGILTIELEDGRQYIVNKHSASKEIWVSSPVSGAAHYAFDEVAKAWLSTRGGAVLSQTLADELQQITGHSVTLS